MRLGYLFMGVASIVSVFATQPLTLPSGASDLSKVTGGTAQEPRDLGLRHWKHKSSEERAHKRVSVRAQREEYDKQIDGLNVIVHNLKQKITQMSVGELKTNLLNDVFELEKKISELQKAREMHKKRVQRRRSRMF